MTSSMAPPRPSSPSTTPDGRTGLRLSSGTYRRRPWQIGLGVALVVLCGAIGGIWNLLWPLRPTFMLKPAKSEEESRSTGAALRSRDPRSLCTGRRGCSRTAPSNFAPSGS